MHLNVRIILVALCISQSGCVDLTTVGNFAKESSLISSNKAMLDDTAAQTTVRSYALKHPIAGVDEKSLVDPGSQAFKDHLVVTNQALAALNGYMTALTQLSGETSASVRSDAGKFDSALTSFKVTDPAAKPTVDASTALSGILLDGDVRKDVAALIAHSQPYVQQITAYLSDQAQITSNEYAQAISFNQQSWGDLMQQTKADRDFCANVSLCAPIYLLATRARDADDAELAAKAKAAAVAATAFKKIGKDNDALAANIDHLDSDALIAILKSDEPDLLTAISNLQSL